MYGSYRSEGVNMTKNRKKNKIFSSGIKRSWTNISGLEHHVPDFFCDSETFFTPLSSGYKNFLLRWIC